MLAHCAFLVFFTVFQVRALSGGPTMLDSLPTECYHGPDVENPHKCCNIPPIFSKEEFESCGFPGDDINERERDEFIPECSHQICLLKIYNLNKGNETVDKDALRGFIDRWADANPDFKPAAEKAKAKCLDVELEGPRHVCQANRIVACFGSRMFLYCPLSGWRTDIAECLIWKSHSDLCSKYFIED